METKQCTKCFNCDQKNNCTIKAKSINEIATKESNECVHYVEDSFINNIMGAIYRQISALM